MFIASSAIISSIAARLPPKSINLPNNLRNIIFINNNNTNNYYNSIVELSTICVSTNSRVCSKNNLCINNKRIYLLSSIKYSKLSSQQHLLTKQAFTTTATTSKLYQKLTKQNYANNTQTNNTNSNNNNCTTTIVNNNNNKEINTSVVKQALPYIDPKFSYVFGKSKKQLKYETIARCFDEALQREKQTTACVVHDEGISKTYEQLNKDVNRLVAGLVRKLNLNRGDEVGIYAFNCYQWLLVQYACNKLGISLVAINPAYKAEELKFVLTKTRVKALFVPGKNSSHQSLNDHWSIISSNDISNLNLPNLKSIITLDGDNINNNDNNSNSNLESTTTNNTNTNDDHMPFSANKSNNVSFYNWSNVFDLTNTGELDAELDELIKQVSPDDVYGIYQTSGTTGHPKGAMISQFTAINNTKFAYQRLFNERQPEFDNIRHNVCLPLPLFHEFAGVLGILAPFCVNGGSFILTGKKYSIESVVKSIRRFNCNAIFLTPTILIDLLDYVVENKIDDLPLKMIIAAGSVVLPELVTKTYNTLTNIEQCVIVYGSSEHGVVATAQSVNEPLKTRSYTVGTPSDFCEVRIADVETNEVKLHGESGEVQTRGFNTMIEYYDDKVKTDETITKSRWFKTGDLGKIDKETGSLSIVGRLKDMIIKGGENVYPAEVERVLHKHPDINDAHVFGIPHERYGEEVCAWIKLRDDIKLTKGFNEETVLNEISEFCKQKLAYFKVPKPKYMRFVDEYPLTAVKKIKKYEMRKQMIELVDRKNKEQQ